MWVDGIEIERLRENESCYLVNDNFIVVTDAKGHIMFIFNLKDNVRDKEVVPFDITQKSIHRYDIIKSIQDEI